MLVLYLQSLGLVTRYRDDEEFRKFCGMLDGLAFLPVCEVVSGMDYLRSIAPPNTQKLVDYFDHTYVNGTVRRPAASSAQSSDTTANVTRRIPPLYEPLVWNVCNITLNEGDRTNNFSEAWNRKYRSVVRGTRTSIDLDRH